MPLDYDHRFMARDHLHRAELLAHLREKHQLPDYFDVGLATTRELGDAHQVAHAEHAPARLSIR